MTYTNYQKGAARERKIIKNWLLRHGFGTMKEANDSGRYIVFRTAGSHSPVDIGIIDINNKAMSFIQSKPESMSQSQKDKLFEELKGLNGIFSVTFEVI
jgi:hypothetical protein